jgi:hypothetical protein
LEGRFAWCQNVKKELLSLHNKKLNLIVIEKQIALCDQISGRSSMPEEVGKKIQEA